jgi:hypothetical protein
VFNRNSFKGKGHMIQLGSRVRDIYTGFEGTLIARTSWLHGCDRLTIEPTKIKDDGSLPESITFDAPRVELVEEEPVRVSKQERTKRPGGPNGPAPSRNRAPR